jgi:hypothetical protein
MKKRTKYLINKRMQLGLTFRFVFLTSVFAAFMGFEAYTTIWPAVSGAIPEHLINAVRHLIFTRFLLFLIPISFVITGFSIIFSHRIAGPLSRIEKTLGQLIGGEDVEYIRIRKKDELKELVARLNEVIRIVKESRTAAKEDSFPQNDERIPSASNRMVG